MSTVGEVLKHKGHQVWGILPTATVYDAVALMAEKNIGAILVMEGDKLIGIVSERDYTRKVILKGKASKTATVREILTSPVTTVTPQDTVEHCMQLMTEKRIRHLPVLEGDRVVGLLSIGDLVNWIINVQRQTIQQLRGYISGQYPG
ncbi:MAG: CBS domain-containing protein [Verrucomicrobia bacterium]|nr:CBS domain-containing protein [Verrucomicrobiota bacterium]